MKFRPLHDRVVVKRIDAEEKTAGGIIIPDTAKEKPSQGEITAVGPGGRDEAGRASIDWGVYGVPETFLVGRDGRIAYKLVGPITADNLARTLKPEIEKALR